MVAKEPEDTRSLFYLAQSYAHAKEYSLALHFYQKRASLKGCPQEIFWALYCIGCLHEDLGHAPETIITAYSKAYQFDPSRAEPLYRLSLYLEIYPLLSRLLIKWAAHLPLPKDAHRLQKWIYDDLSTKQSKIFV